MSIRIQNRRDTTTGWNTADPILAAGEIGHNTTLNAFKVGDGTSLWSELDYFQPSANITPSEVGAIALTEKGAAGGVAELDSSQNVLTKTGVVFEGATADAYETTLVVTDPTTDRTITLPDSTGTVALTSDITNAINSLVNGAPSALDTLNELATALNNDASYASTITTALGGKIDKSIIDATGDLILGTADNTVGRLPIGANGYLLTSNGTTATWAQAPISLPSQTGNSGKYLTTDGSTASWGTVDLSSKQDKVTGVSDTEISYLDGVTSSIQTQLDSKLASADLSETAQDAVNSALTAGTGITKTYNDAANTITVAVDTTTIQARVSGVSDTEIGYLDGVTSAIQTQIDSKLASSTASSTYAPIASPTFTGTVSGITKSMVGLGNVDNTSDANKPVSTATQTALDLKANLASPTFTGTVNAADLTLSGNLTVNGTTTNINSTNLVVEDKNIVIGDTTSPTDTTADGGGITLKGTTDKTLNWVDATDSWTSSEHIDLATGKVIKVAGTQVLSSTQYTGNAATVTNGVYTTGTYSDPSWITSLAASKVGLGNVENTALSTWAGSTNITTLGTVATGTWSATTIALNKGGTGATTQAGAANAVLPSQTSNSGKYLTTDGTNVSWGTVSSYSAPTLGSTSIASGATVSNVNGLTINSTTIPTSKTLVVTTDKISVLAATTSAELAGVISDETGSGALVFATSPTISLPSIDNPRYGYTTTATAAGTTTLTVSSNLQQFFTGSTTQTVVLPVASTMVLGQGFYIENNSTGNLTVNSSGGNLVATVTPGTTVLITNILTSGTTAASWDVDWHGFGTITGTGSNVLGTAPTISNLTLTGTLTAASTAGTSGQVLQSTGTGVTWATPAAGAAFSEFMLIGA